MAVLIVSCPVCSESVHVSCGFIVRHGVSHHGVFFKLCSGSGMPFVSIDSCCG